MIVGHFHMVLLFILSVSPRWLRPGQQNIMPRLNLKTNEFVVLIIILDWIFVNN